MSFVPNLSNSFATMSSSSSSCDRASVFLSNNIEVSEANFLFEVPYFGKNQVTLSPTAQVRNLPWTIMQHSADFIIEQRKELKFGMNIDLNKFVKKHIDSPTKYVLHAVLVRCDTFSAFVNQNSIGWLKFDNDTVSRCTEKEAMEDNFGCVQMLVYLKCSDPTSGNHDYDDKAIFNCIICMEVRKGSVIFSTTCGHVFCERCIKKEITVRQKCPVCQNGLTEKDIHPIYI